jgi:membrane-bound ClpP family serine protease
VRRASAWRLALLLVLLPLRAWADDLALGQFITVRNPITSEEVHRVKKYCDWAIGHGASAEPDRGPLKLVFDFNGGPVASSPDFGPCNDLAEYILGLHDLTTIAFVHGEVSRHTLLPVLACKELVMSSQARLGPALLEGEAPLSPAKLQGYEDVIKGRRLCPALVRKLLDKDMEVLQGVRQGAVWYIDARKEQEETQHGVLVTNHVPVIGKGPGIYTKTLAQTLGLFERSMETREELQREYNLPPTSLREYPVVEGSHSAWRFVVSGPVTEALSESLQRHIHRVLAPDRHATLIILQLECNGGDPTIALRLAEFLHTLKDDRREQSIRTVAYIPERAPDTGLILALGCSEIVMRKDAEIGDCSLFLEQGGAGEAPEAWADEDKDSLLLQPIRDLARNQGYRPVLIRGMFYRPLAIHEVVTQKGRARWDLFTDAQLKADRDSNDPQWKEIRTIKPGGAEDKPLVLKADVAREVRLARQVVDDLDGLYADYGLKPDQVRTGGHDWLDDLLYVLRLPVVSIFLVMLGIICLILELKMPGVGLPGVIAALCFVIFFWAHAYDAGVTMLAVLLFLLGLVLIGLEIFVLPGTAVLGVSGALLIVSSLTLVTLEKWPQAAHDWLDLASTMTMFGLTMVGSVGAAFVLALYLPHIPYINRIILKPPNEVGEDGLEEPAPSLYPGYAELLGAIGVAATPLRPAGKVKFGDEFIDVVAEGTYVAPGARVQVIEVEGYRIVVKEV